MICAKPQPVTPKLIASRSTQARERAKLAQAALADCRLCAHDCGVNRLAGETGRCHAEAETRCFLAQTEVTDELELIPTFAVALSGCDLRCDFCITGAESWNPRAGESFSALEMAAKARLALQNGAQTVMVLGGEPTIHLPAALALVAALPDDAKLVWKTNAYGSAQARELLDGMFDVWLADFKFGNDHCAQRLAKVPNYTRIVRENLMWFAGAERPVGVQASACPANTPRAGLKTPERGCVVPDQPQPASKFLGREVFPPCCGWSSTQPRSIFRQALKRELQPGELIVRHLLMPGHVECCWRPVAVWLAENLPGVKVNLRSGFWPAWKSARHTELCGTLASDETRRAWQVAEDLGLNLIP